MFTVLYTFRVKPGMEETFQRSWAFITEEYMRTRGSLGSRLHKDENGTFVAIALWPDREHWEAQGPTDSPELTNARDRMREACEEIQTTHELVVVQDLWRPSRS
ncbi:MAG: antibiotic biosynthesis monooxygenase [Flavobacteriales bacterium]|nr:antibiotic biosynthesis monooxygenase [Flavobacteriales bacterium]